MRRRPLLIAASAIVLIGIVIGIYMVFFAKSAQLTVSDNPFGNLGSGEAGTLPEANTGAGTEVAPRLLRISDRAVAEGAVAFVTISTTTETGADASGTPQTTETSVRDTEVRFIDRASGNIYKFLERARSLTRLSNKTLPGIQRASWLPDGSVAYVQFLTGTGGGEHVATYVLPSSGEGGFFLEQDLAQADTAGSSTLVTLLSGTSGSTASVSKSDGTNAKTLFTSLLSSLVLHPARAAYFVNTKPSLQLDGYALQVQPVTGGFTRLLGPLRGLSSLPSPDGKQLLYSYMDQGTLHMGVLDTATHVATALPVTTFTEKCTWAPDSLSVYCGIPTTTARNLPDDWYQGAITFSDRIWKIDMTQRLAALVVDPVAVGKVSIDAVALTVDPDQSFLIFTDRTSGTLWSYEL